MHLSLTLMQPPNLPHVCQARSKNLTKTWLAEQLENLRSLPDRPILGDVEPKFPSFGTMPVHTYQQVAEDDDLSDIKQSIPTLSTPLDRTKPRGHNSRWLISILLCCNVLLMVLAMVLGVQLWRTQHDPPYCKVYPEAGSRRDRKHEPQLQLFTD